MHACTFHSLLSKNCHSVQWRATQGTAVRLVVLWMGTLLPPMEWPGTLSLTPFRCCTITHLWCMHFEAKHQWFKKLAHNLGNFINVAKTLAWRHQRLSCYDLMGPVLEKNYTNKEKCTTHTHLSCMHAFNHYLQPPYSNISA